MKLSQLHKRLAIQSLNTKDPLAKEKAKAIGYSVNGEFVSFHDLVKAKYEEIIIKDKNGKVKYSSKNNKDKKI